MRRARFALARGADAAAAAALEKVRRADPGSPRGLEAALLLADLRFAEGYPDRAESILAEAHEHAQPAIAAPIGLARGWLAVSRGAPDEARARFEEGRRTGSALARAVAEIGRVWSSLSAGQPVVDLAPLVAVAHAEGPDTLRFAAGWTLARAHARNGDHRRALRELRRLRRSFRHTSLEDDLELSLGLAQLDAGKPRRALRTFRRLERRFAGQAGPSAEVSAGIRLADLRASDADFVARVSSLYAQRRTRSIGLIPFLGALLDRRAAADANAASALAERALGTRKGGSR